MLCTVILKRSVVCLLSTHSPTTQEGDHAAIWQTVHSTTNAVLMVRIYIPFHCAITSYMLIRYIQYNAVCTVCYILKRSVVCLLSTLYHVYSGDHAPLEYIAVHSIVLYVHISRVPIELINRPPPFSHSFFFFQFWLCWCHICYSLFGLPLFFTTTTTS